jgi:hypothetical protein
MEGQVWVIVESLLALVQPVGRRFRYGLQEILRVVLWGALHDRPMVWACQAENWPLGLRPACLPHPSTISRRWRSSAVQAEAYRLHDVSVARLGVVSRYAAIDGRSLLVGGCSKDPDARCGRAAGAWVLGTRCMPWSMPGM